MRSPAAIICFGEALWDLRAAGRRPGGAPCRLALHLHQLGRPVQLISRVGDDELGHELLACLAAAGLDASLVQLSASHLTGLVKAPGSGRAKLVQPLAWDYIQYSEALGAAVEQAPLLVYGPLATRGRTSRETLYRLLQRAALKVLDLRAFPGYAGREVVRYLLQHADLVQLDEAGLAEVMAGLSPLPAPETALPWLAHRFGLRAICLTRRAGGASVYADGTWWHSPGQKGGPVPDEADGYGDAFLAGLLAGWATGQPSAECLRRACAVGAAVARQPGAFLPQLTENDLHCPLYPA